MSDLENKAVDILDKLELMATKYTPDVVNAAVEATRISAIGDLIYGVLAIICGFFCIWICKNFAKYARTKKVECGYMSDWEFGIAISMLAGCAGGAICFLICIGNLFDVWNYVALYNPKLALAHKMLGI